MKSRPVTRRSTCVDLNLPISNPDFACDNCKPFLDVTVNSRKKRVMCHVLSHGPLRGGEDIEKSELCKNAKKSESSSDLEMKTLS